MPSRTCKFRGSRTHGRGTKSGRGKGIRGGSGNAGYHKHKYAQVIKYKPDYFGRHGFKRHAANISRSTTLNLSDIEERFEAFRKQGAVKHEGEITVVDLGKLGIDKLLGSGHPSRKMKILVSEASEQAREKIKAAGGEVVLGSEPAEKPEVQESGKGG